MSSATKTPTQPEKPPPAKQPQKRQRRKPTKTKEEKLEARRERDKILRRDKAERDGKALRAPANSWNNQENVAMLGTRPDSEIAKLLGISPSAVERARRRRCIKTYRPDSLKWDAASIALLGTMSDQKLGEKLGLTRSLVRTKRESLGIAAKFVQKVAK